MLLTAMGTTCVWFTMAQPQSPNSPSTSRMSCFPTFRCPQANGYQVARCLRERYDLRGKMLVALTGYGQAEDRRQALQAGFDEHMVKPPEFEHLRDLFHSAASRRGDTIAVITRAGIPAQRPQFLATSRAICRLPGPRMHRASADERSFGRRRKSKPRRRESAGCKPSAACASPEILTVSRGFDTAGPQLPCQSGQARTASHRRWGWRGLIGLGGQPGIPAIRGRGSRGAQ